MLRTCLLRTAYYLLRDRVAEIKRAVRVEESRVHALVLRPAALVRRLDPVLALRERIAGHLDAAVAAAALRGLEVADVDLRAEDLAHASHVAGTAERIEVAVEVAAPELETSAGLHHPVAEGAALPALAGRRALLGRLRYWHGRSLDLRRTCDLARRPALAGRGAGRAPRGARATARRSSRCRTAGGGSPRECASRAAPRTCRGTR